MNFENGDRENNFIYNWQRPIFLQNLRVFALCQIRAEGIFEAQISGKYLKNIGFLKGSSWGFSFVALALLSNLHFHLKNGGFEFLMQLDTVDNVLQTVGHNR